MHNGVLTHGTPAGTQIPIQLLVRVNERQQYFITGFQALHICPGLPDLTDAFMSQHNGINVFRKPFKSFVDQFYIRSAHSARNGFY